MFWEELYKAVAPLARDDEGHDFALRSFMQSVAAPFELIQELVRDTDDGKVGWSILLDPTRAPDEVLPWLVQMVGAYQIANESYVSMRARIVDAEGYRRGTLASIHEAATRAGAPDILVQERYGGSAYAIRILFTTAQYTDEIFAKVIEKIPAGIVVTSGTWDGVVYSDILAEPTNLTYADLLTNYTDYADLRGV